MSFPDTIDRVKAIHNGITGDTVRKIYVESVGYQESVIQQLAHDGVKVEGITHHGQDKRARLALTTHHADAFAIVVLKLEEYIHRPKPNIFILSRDYDDHIENSPLFRRQWRNIF